MQENTFTLLSPQQTWYIHSAIRFLLYYAPVVYGSMLSILGKIAANQPQPTIRTKQDIERLLDYANTYPQCISALSCKWHYFNHWFRQKCFVMPKARSRIASHFPMLDCPERINREIYNGAIHIECKTLCHVVSSIAEAEANGVFQNAIIVLPLQHILIDIGHP